MFAAAAVAGKAALLARRARLRQLVLETLLASVQGVPGADWPPGGIESGSPAPRDRLLGLDGKWRVVPEQLPALLLFTKSGELMNERLGALIDRLPERVHGVMVVAVTPTTAHARLEGISVPLLLDPDGAYAAAFGVKTVPAAVLVEEGGVTGSPVALGAAPVRELLDLIMDVYRPDSAPLEEFVGFTAIDKDGTSATIHSHGEPLIIAVIGRNCRHSTRLLPTLRAAAFAQGAELAVIVAGGSPRVDPNIAAPMLIDDTDQASVRFGYRGTPAVIQVSADARIESVVSGTQSCIEVLSSTFHLPQ